MKAGLAPGSWPAGITTHTFTAAHFTRKAGGRSSSAA
jgi:hypothetical protein